MKTPYNEIVNIASIGSQTNPISLNETRTIQQSYCRRTL